MRFARVSISHFGTWPGIAQDFVETEQTELGLSCIGCHMPPIQQRTANDPAGEREYPLRRSRSHRIRTPRDPAFLRTAFRLGAERREGSTVLTVENQCGHRVPGLVGRKLTFRARLLDAAGEVVAEVDHTFDNRAYLPVEDVFELVLEGVGATLELEGLHEAPGIRPPVSFLQRSFRVE